MRNIQKFSALLVLTCAAYGQSTVVIEDLPAPSDSDQKTILARITENALKYSKDLPDFVCSKLTRHSADPTGFGQRWRLVDSVDQELNYLNHQESYRVVTVNGKKSSGTGPSGSDSMELGNLESWILAPSVQAEIKWAGWATIDQRKSYAFAYGVAQPKSQFFIGSKNRVAAGFTGMLYADAETAKIMRIILIAQSPANYAVKNVTYDLTYALSKIGDQQFVVPVKSDFRASEGKTLVWTEVEFRRYRKPGAADKFDTR